MRVCVCGVVVLFPLPYEAWLALAARRLVGVQRCKSIHIHTIDDCPDRTGLLAHPTCSDEDGQIGLSFLKGGVPPLWGC